MEDDFCRSYQRRDLLNRVYASDEVRQYAIEINEELLSGLDSKVFFLAGLF